MADSYFRLFDELYETYNNKDTRILLAPCWAGPHAVKLILDLRAVTLELGAHPKVRLVVPDAARVIGRDERIERGANLAAGDHDLLIGKLAPRRPRVPAFRSRPHPPNCVPPIPL